MAYYGTSGQFGAGMQNPQFGQWSQQSPTPWTQPWWQQADPTQAIQGAQNDIRRTMNQNMNNVASRLGAQGMIGAAPQNSGVYAQQLGNVATDASRQMADVANKYTYDAASQEQGRRAQAWDSSQNRQLSWDQQQAQSQQALMSDWWNRYYDALKSGGSQQYMQQWQTGGIPQAQQYAKSINPWL